MISFGLSDQALQVLRALQAAMLAESRREVSGCGTAPPAVPETRKDRFPEPIARLQEKNRQVMPHAKVRGGAFQRMCRRRDWAAPVY